MALKSLNYKEGRGFCTGTSVNSVLSSQVILLIMEDSTCLCSVPMQAGMVHMVKYECEAQGGG